MLLDEIIALATDNKHSISVLLRKCIILAHQIKNDKLKAWAYKELNGYANNDDELPDYRITPAQAKGHFSGWGGASMSHWPIPSALLEPQHQRFAEKVHLTQAISAYEDLAANAKGSLTVAWPTNLVLYYQERIENSKDMNLIAAYQKIPKGAMVEVVDAVRTRVLNLALEIRSDIGEKDEDLKQITPREAEKIEQTVVQQIFGGNVYVATGQSSIAVQQNIAVGDWGQLERTLRNSGLSKEDTDELSLVAEQDGWDRA